MRYHVANLAIRSYIDCRHGLEQPQGEALVDFLRGRVWRGQLQGRGCYLEH